MDAEEIAVLAAGLGKALADGLAANEAAKEEKDRAEKRVNADVAEAERIAKKKSEALHEVLSECAENSESLHRVLKALWVDIATKRVETCLSCSGKIPACPVP